MTSTSLHDDRPQAVAYADRWGRLPDDVEWLWPGWLAAGCVVAVEGQPGSGKSSIVADMVARLTTGDAMPGAVAGSRHDRPTDCIVVSIGGDPPDLTRGRLRVAGADPSRCHAPIFRHFAGDDLDLPDDMWRLEWVVRDAGARAVVVIDPLASVLSSGDPFIARRVLFTLGRIAEKSAATVLVTTHGIDSGATLTAARIVWSVTCDDGDAASTRTLSVLKSNLGPRPRSLTFRLTVDGATDSTAVEPARVEWRPATR
jgi:putative DNA primase/helicase